MKRIAILLVFLPFLPLHAQEQDISILVNQATFLDPTTGSSYLDISIGVDVRTLTLHKEGGHFQAGVEVTILLKQDDRIVNFDKVSLQTGKLSALADSNMTLTGQRRMLAENGTYQLEVMAKDLFDEARKTTLPEETFMVDFAEKSLNISDIWLVDYYEKGETNPNFSRHGLTMYPYLLPYYPTLRENLLFFAEVYGLDREYLDEDVLITYSINPKGSSQPLTGLQSFQKQKGQMVNIVMGSLPLAEVPSGEFDLKLTVRDKTNTVLSTRSLSFYRSNKMGITELANLALIDIENTFVAALPDERMDFYLGSLKPIAVQKEVNAINSLLETPAADLKKQFFYNFWVTRDIKDPAKYWNAYHSMVLYTERQYATMTRKGFETERGRVYLQYGPPNEMDVSPYDGGARPYEIWTYNRTQIGETNVFFVFYNDDLVSNEFRLLHSSAMGEPKNDKWQEVLSQSGMFVPNHNLDRQPVRDRMGTDVANPHWDNR